jgi:hypothetical protein
MGCKKAAVMRDASGPATRRASTLAYEPKNGVQ